MVNWRIVALRDRSLFTGVGRATIFKGESLYLREGHYFLSPTLESKGPFKKKFIEGRATSFLD